jgi:hypothetical protein
MAKDTSKPKKSAAAAPKKAPKKTAKKAPRKRPTVIFDPLGPGYTVSKKSGG